MRKPREVRTPETEARYRAYLTEQKTDQCPFCLNESGSVVRRFRYWYICENAFPYDRFYSTSHLLIPHRHLENFWDWNDQEYLEYLEIRRELANSGSYDELLENFPVGRTQLHFHLHLLAY